MQMKSDGAEIDDAVGMQVYGDWLRPEQWKKS